jgi:hypothetical protein
MDQIFYLMQAFNLELTTLKMRAFLQSLMSIDSVMATILISCVMLATTALCLVSASTLFFLVLFLVTAWCGYS